MDVNFNPNLQPLSMRNGVKKPAGNIDDMPKGKTDRTSVDANQLFGEAQEASAADNVQTPDIMRKQGPTFKDETEAYEAFIKGELDYCVGKAGDLYYIVYAGQGGNLRISFSTVPYEE